MSKRNQARRSFAAVFGCALGALVGMLVVAVLGFALLATLFWLKPPTGDVTGMGGLILLLAPFGAGVGAVCGVRLAKQHFAPDADK